MTQIERVRIYVQKINKVFSRYDCEKHFREEHLPDLKDRISGESVNRHLRTLHELKEIKHPEFMGVEDKSKYELVK